MTLFFTNWFYTLFSFHGRIKRNTWWLANVVIWILTVAIGSLFLVLDPAHHHFVSSMLTITLVWMRMSVNVKRLHDTNLSGVWAFVEIIPMCSGVLAYILGIPSIVSAAVWIIGSIVLFFIVAFRKGTAPGEENRFDDN